MESTQALAVVRSLANGVDPESGEVFPCQEGRTSIQCTNRTRCVGAREGRTKLASRASGGASAHFPLCAAPETSCFSPRAEVKSRKSNKKGYFVPVIVHIEAASVDARLVQLRLDQALLRTAVARGQLAVDNCTLHHPRMYAPLAGWAETVRGLREPLSVQGWTNSDDKNYALCVDSTGRNAIAVATGNEETGLVSGTPATKASKGPSTLEAVMVNVAQLKLFQDADLPAPAAPAHIEDEGKRATWILLIHRSAAETRAELSLPVAIGADGRVTDWQERIILGAIPRDPQPLQVVPPELPDLDVQVRRRI
jgi:hypothetical protein